MERYVGQHHGSSKGASDGDRGERSTVEPGARTPVSYEEALANPTMGAIRHPGKGADISTATTVDGKPIRRAR